MNYLDILRTNERDQLIYSGKTLEERLTGRFYTPEFISNILVDNLLSLVRIKDELKIIDPFCGDGRLIASFLRKSKDFFFKKHVYISLWDCDEVAIIAAKQNVQVVLNDCMINGTIKAICGDSFYLAQQHTKSFDLCITNPPWETIKPDRRELERLHQIDREQLICQLRNFDENLKNLYPLSQPTRKFSGWGTNLARVGTELATKLTGNGGAVGIVCPAALFADQMSTSLRRWLLEEVAISDMAYFPAETRLFDRVDQPSVCFAGIRGKATSVINLSLFDSSHSLRERGTLSAVEIGKQPSLTIPFQTGFSGLAITSLLSHLPRFGELENASNGLWAGRELDETGHKRFLTDQGEYRFIKGRMISRFEIVEWPTAFINTNAPSLPPSINFERLAWRDVSRPTQKRRVQATIIPAKWVAGNSLHVAHFRNNCPYKLRQLLAIINSLPFEFQARSFLSTSHVSLGVIRNVRLPALEQESLLIELCRSCIDKKAYAESHLEVAVAKMYGLNRESFAAILEIFPKINGPERATLLSSDLW